MVIYRIIKIYFTLAACMLLQIDYFTLMILDNYGTMVTTYSDVFYLTDMKPTDGASTPLREQDRLGELEVASPEMQAPSYSQCIMHIHCVGFLA